MPIVSDTDTAKKFLQVNYTNDDASLPPMRKAESELRKLLGKPLFDEVQANITAGTTDELTELAQELVTLYAYWLHLPDMQVQIGEKGLSVASTDNNVQPFKWQYREKRDGISAKYLVAVDDLINYLFEAAPVNWVKPALYEKRTITTGAQFSRIYPLRNPEAVFLQLLPIIANVEETYIYKAIGKETLEALAADDPAMFFVTRAVAHFTIKEATAKLSCQLSADGFTVLMDPPDDPRSGRKNAPQPQIAAAGYSAEKEAHGFVHDLVVYLNNNASATTYPEYFNSKFYKDPTACAPSINASLAGIFIF